MASVGRTLMSNRHFVKRFKWPWPKTKYFKAAFYCFFLLFLLLFFNLYRLLEELLIFIFMNCFPSFYLPLFVNVFQIELVKKHFVRWQLRNVFFGFTLNSVFFFFSIDTPKYFYLFLARLALYILRQNRSPGCHLYGIKKS